MEIKGEIVKASLRGVASFGLVVGKLRVCFFV